MLHFLTVVFRGNFHWVQKIQSIFLMTRCRSVGLIGDEKKIPINFDWMKFPRWWNSAERWIAKNLKYRRSINFSRLFPPLIFFFWQQEKQTQINFHKPSERKEWNRVAKRKDVVEELEKTKKFLWLLCLHAPYIFTVCHHSRLTESREMNFLTLRARLSFVSFLMYIMRTSWDCEFQIVRFSRFPQSY